MSQPIKLDDQLVLIGKRIRDFRKQKGLTLQTLADMAGLSTAYISQMENGRVNINLETLSLISHAMQVPIIDFFTEPKAIDISVVRKDELRWFPLVGNVFESLLVKFRSNMEIFIIRLPAGMDTGASSSHQGEEFSYVVKGSVQIILDGTNQHDLKTGDGIYYRSTIPHVWRNPYEDEAEVIVVNTPATY